MENNTVNTKNGNLNMWVIIVGVVVLLMVITGGYWYMTNKSAEAPKQTPAILLQQNLDTLDQEISSLDLGNIDNDLSDIDKDLQTL